MTALGKILVFVVLVLSLIWNGLVVNGYVTRTNWKAEAKKYQDEATKAAAAATEMKKLLEDERAAAEDAKRVLKEQYERLYNQLSTVSNERKSLLDQYNVSFVATEKQSIELATVQTNVKRLSDQVDNQDELLSAKEKQVNELTLSENAAKVLANNAKLDATSQAQRAERLSLQVQDLSETIESARRAGSGSRTSITGRPAVPAPDGFSGTITSVSRSGDDFLVTLTPGMDVGLKQNVELSVSRLGNESKYLGKVIVISTNPKDAVGRFIPRSDVRLTADLLPRAGDALSAPR